MTAAAGFRDVGAIDSGPGIAGRQDLRQVVICGVTIDAGGGLHSTLNTAGVKAEIVGGVSVGVKLVAAEVRQSFAGCVTSLAVELWNCRGRR